MPNTFEQLFKEKEGSREFINSSIRENKELGLEKIYLIQLIWDDSAVKKNPPFTLIRPGYTTTQPRKIVIPSLKKELIVYDNIEQKIYTDADLSIIDRYPEDLNKIERILQDITSSLDGIEFYMIDNLIGAIDRIRFILLEYEGSIQHFNYPEIKKIHKNTLNILDNLETSLMNRATYLDMKTGRMLTIVSIIFFPALFIAGWMGMNFGKRQMAFLRWEYSYITTLIVLIVFMSIVSYYYRNDLL